VVDVARSYFLAGKHIRFVVGDGRDLVALKECYSLGNYDFIFVNAFRGEQVCEFVLTDSYQRDVLGLTANGGLVLLNLGHVRPAAEKHPATKSAVVSLPAHCLDFKDGNETVRALSRSDSVLAQVASTRKRRPWLR